jgi:hypothetical protein
MICTRRAAFFAASKYAFGATAAGLPHLHSEGIILHQLAKACLQLLTVSRFNLKAGHSIHDNVGQPAGFCCNHRQSNCTGFNGCDAKRFCLGWQNKYVAGLI